MAKAVKTKVVEVVEAPKTEGTPLPMDGSGGAKFIEEQGGVSKAIRALVAQGHKYGSVAKMLDKRYQHVRNVMITPVGKKTAE